jgi:predicted enzyme related to lactoylglutathione lyase
MSRNPVRWFEIYVQDMKRAKRFYESVFEVKLERLNNPVTLNTPSIELWSFPSNMSETGCSGALVKMEGAGSGGLGTIVYFASEDCAGEEKRVREFGRTIPATNRIGEYGTSHWPSTQGNVMGHSMVRWGLCLLSAVLLMHGRLQGLQTPESVPDAGSRMVPLSDKIVQLPSKKPIAELCPR